MCTTLVAKELFTPCCTADNYSVHVVSKTVALQMQVQIFLQRREMPIILMQMTLFTSFCKLAHRSVQCIRRRIIALAAGDRFRSRIGAVPRLFGDSTIYPFCVRSPLQLKKFMRRHKLTLKFLWCWLGSYDLVASSN